MVQTKGGTGLRCGLRSCPCRGLRLFKVGGEVVNGAHHSEYSDCSDTVWRFGGVAVVAVQILVKGQELKLK